MKALRLASVALQAERVRWRHAMRRFVVMGAFIAVALVVFMVGLIAGHAALFALLVDRLPPAGAAGALAGGDLVVALVLVWIGLGMGPSSNEREAAALSDSAQAQIRDSLKFTNMFSFSTILTLFELFRGRRK